METIKPQGYRFHKSGSASPIHPSLSRSNSTSGIPLARSNSTNSLSASSSSDIKLHQIVRKIISQTPSLLIGNKSSSATTLQAKRNASNAIVDIIYEKHREYRRKEREAIVKGVDACLAEILAENSYHSGSSNSTNNSSGKKRRVAVGGGSEIDNTYSNNEGEAKRSKIDSCEAPPLFVVDRNSEVVAAAAAANVSEGEEKTSSGGNMLNASLRNRYKEQREKDHTSAAAAGSCASVASKDESVDQLHDTSNKTMDEPTKSTAVANSNTTTPNPTPKKKKKVKRTPSSSIQHESSNDNPTISSSTTTQILPSPRPTERYSTLGGISTLLTTIRQLIEYPLSHPELFTHLGIEPPRGVLLRGPPGCGKTHLAKAIAGELNVSYFQVSAPELVGGVSGESEARVRTLFESAANYAPSIIFIDEIDAIAPKRGDGGGGGGKSMEKRIVAQLLTSMDGLSPDKTRNGSAVIVMGATNRPDALDAALRRAGRFDREIVLGAPDEKARVGILRVMTRAMRVEGDLDYGVLAKKTPGFVGADVRSLTKEAAVVAINRIFRLLNDDDNDGGGGTTVDREEALKLLSSDSNVDAEEGTVVANAKDPQATVQDNDIRTRPPLTPEQLAPLYITMDDFLSAIPNVQPSSKREGFATVPDVAWSDIGALSNIREELTLSVLEPIAHPERFEALGLPLPAGVLLYGPPGCGKTLLAKAIANESGANFISVKGPELLDKYVGESERSVRVVFERARSSSPCIIFFDELDSLCPKRGSDGGGGGGVSERVVNQLLTEMDGLDSRRSVFVIAATNRPELIDPAMLRPGRLDKLLYVSLPTPDDRLSILRALSKKVNLASDVNLEAIANDPHAEGFSGADCAALLREAGLAVLRDGVLNRSSVGNNTVADSTEKKDENDTQPLQITAHHFKYAFDHVLPSVSKKDQARYDRLRERMARARTRSGGENAANGDESGVDVKDATSENNA
ncbi:hypothetical protein ACHAWO_012588 [Cyclotella atomus]|uniref:AAA+ ATPase domain-containing protein n=1 Tax=Cyclotella atomus TaxID=382360 RepID=A0ABD3QB36_9STRA